MTTVGLKKNNKVALVVTHILFNVLLFEFHLKKGFTVEWAEVVKLNLKI